MVAHLLDGEKSNFLLELDYCKHFGIKFYLCICFIIDFEKYIFFRFLVQFKDDVVNRSTSSGNY